MCLSCVISNLPQTPYCERGDSAALLSEPINAFSNVAFLIVSFIARHRLVAKNIKDKKVLALPWMLAVVGVGSFLYHTARSPLTLIFDALPIYFFILYALFLVLKKLLDNNVKSLITLVGFVLLEVFLTAVVPKEFLNGSIRHLAVLFFVVVLGFFAEKRFGKKVIVPMISIMALYASAIFFRSVDMQLCNWLPVGTHFLWHIFAAIAGGFAIELVSLLYMPKSNKDFDE